VDAVQPVGYTDALDPDEQITAEEEIADTIAVYQEQMTEQALTEEALAALGRDILLRVLRRFRPDLVAPLPENQ
jgi:hypothetical protein